MTRDVRFSVAAAITLALAVLVNFWRISVPTVLSDEPVYARAAALYLGIPVTSRVKPGDWNLEHPPLAKYLFGFAQLISGNHTFAADRVVAAICTVLTAVLLAGWIGVSVNRWAGLAAGAMSALLPEGAATVGRFGRYGMLDPVAELFMLGSVVLAFAWMRSSGRRGRWLAVAAGCCAGLAASAKENGALGIIGVVVLGLVLARGQRELLRTRLRESLLAALTSAVVFVLLYLPVASPVRAIRYMVRFQDAQSSAGHLVGFNGRVTAHPPWWTNLWFTGHGLTPAVTAALVVLACCALVPSVHRVTYFCLAALAAPFVFHCLIAGVALPYYWTEWMPAFFGVAAIGGYRVVRAAATATIALVRNVDSNPLVTGVRSRPGLWLRAVAFGSVSVIAVLALAVGVSSTVRRTYRVRPQGPAVLVAELREHHLAYWAPAASWPHGGRVLAAGVYGMVYKAYTAGLKISYTMPKTMAGIDAIVIGQRQCRTVIDRRVRATVAVNLAAGRLVRVYTDTEMTLYGASGPLQMPTADDVEAQPPSRLSDGC